MGREAVNNSGELTRRSIESFYSFNDSNIDARNKYIKEKENYISFPEGLKQFINRKYGDIPKSELSTFIEKCSRERGVGLSMPTVKNWLSSDKNKKGNPQCNPTSRDNMYKLCFALGFTVEETKDFFGKVYLDRPYDSRDVREAVYLFCMNNNYSFEKANELISIIDAGNHSGQNNEMTITKTRVLSDEILKIKSERDFISFIDVNRNSFGVKNNTAMSCYRELLEDAKKMAGKTSNEALLDIIYDCRLEEIRKCSNATIRGNSDFVDVVRMNFPQKKQLSDIEIGKASYDTIRKALILLKFYSFFMHVGKDNAEEDIDEFCVETNDMLIECGYSPLYPRNPYDWIFMYCAACSHDKDRDVDINQPLEELKDIMADMLNFE